MDSGETHRPQPLPETLRTLYLAILPLAGCVAARLEGGAIGRGWGFGIAIALFLYHYLLWALHETERGGGPMWKRWAWLISPLLVLSVLQAGLLPWLVEQTVLESVAFIVAMAALAMRKCLDEGKDAPWFLAIAVFVAPAAAIAVKLGSIWWSRRDAGLAWPDLAFAVAFLLSLGQHHRRLHPFVLGRDQLREPISSPGRTAFIAVWFLLLLVGAMVLGG